MLSDAIQIELLTELLKKGQSVHLEARGGCMRPWAFDGDVIVISPLRVRLRKGMILLTRAGDDLYAHRLVEIARNGWVRTRGDTTDWTGRWNAPAEILGQVTAVHHRWGVTIPLDSAPLQLAGRLVSPLGWACLWAFRAVRRLTRRVRNGESAG